MSFERLAGDTRVVDSRELFQVGSTAMPRRVCLLSAFAQLAPAALLQYLGAMAERWLFFAEANHPQNLYYQRMA